MTYQHDTYDRRVQLGASRRRREDAETLHNARRWAGAVYMAGYAIECSLKALICYNENKNSFRETRMFQRGGYGNTLHSLTLLLKESSALRRKIMLDRSNKYKNAWITITDLWQKDELRYWDRLGNEDDCQRFIDAVKLIHTLILNQQKEAS